MATYTANCPADNSTLANYVSWSTFMSIAFQTFGWVQTNDTGQVMWSGMNLTAVSVSGSNGIYTYNSLTGLALANGRALNITGMTHSANNGTFVITSFTGTTFTVVNASAVAESGSTGVVTKITSLPSSSYVANYEIWQATDSYASTTPIYIKMSYGYSSSAVAIDINTGTSTNGTGTMTGNSSGGQITTSATNQNNNGGTLIPCYASGNAGEIRFMMWQGATNYCNVFGVERSKDTSGNNTTSYFSLLVGFSPTNNNTWFQQTYYNGLATPREFAWLCFVTTSISPTTGNFNGSTAACPVFPLIGYLGNPMLGFAAACAYDVAEGAQLTISIYGSNHNYIASKVGYLANTGSLYQREESGACLMRYE
jgi:hypothetical protein